MFIAKTIAECYPSGNSMMHIACGVADCYALSMDVRDSRNRNLTALLRGFKSLREFAETVDVAPAHASQMKNGTRQMGDEVARRIEQKLNKPRGWMDHPHEDQATPPDPSALKKLQQHSLSPKSKAQLKEITQDATLGLISEDDIDLVYTILQRTKQR